MRTNILIGLIDDHKALTDAMVSLLNQKDSIEVIAIAHNLIDGIKLIEESNCDVYLIDMNLGTGDSCDLIRIVKNKNKIPIVLSAYSDIYLIKRAIKMGAKAYVSKSSAALHITKAIKQTWAGGTYFDNIVQSCINASAGLTPQINTAKERAMATQLTPREKDVIRLIAQEYTSEEIAQELHLSKNTIDGYRKNLISKTNAKNSVGLSIWAIHNHLIKI